MLEAELCGEAAVYDPTATGNCKSKSVTECGAPLKWDDANLCTVRDQAECEDAGFFWNVDGTSPVCETPSSSDSATDRR